MSNEQLINIADVYVEGLKSLTAKVGFDKAYGVIVANLINDESYTWEEKKGILNCLRREWLNTNKEVLPDGVEELLEKEQHYSPTVEKNLERMRKGFEALLSHEDYKQVEGLLTIVQQESFMQGFYGGLKLFIGERGPNHH